MNDKATAENDGDKTESWRDSLPDDLKDNGTLNKYNSIEDAMRGHISLEKKVGSETVLMPTENSSEEEVNSFLNKTGRPDKPGGYTLTAPNDADGKAIEISEADMNNFKEDAWKAGISSKRAQQLLEDTYTRNSLAKTQADVDSKKEVETRKEDNLRKLRTEWGSSHYDNNMKIAETAIIAHGGQELLDILKEKHLDTEPTILLAFAKVAKERGEDTLPDTNDREGYKTTGDLEKRKAEIIDNLDGPFYKAGHADHERTVKEYGDITKQLFDANNA